MMTLPFSLIAALADNNVIGINNQMPWHLPADLQHFKAVTTGKPVIMGRKTWESIGRALPNRLNIVVTRQGDFVAEGAEIYPSLEKAIERANLWALEQQVGEVMLIGGAQLYTQALKAKLIDKLYLTRVHISPAGDAVFPVIDQNSWRLIQAETFAEEQGKPAYTIECWVRA